MSPAFTKSKYEQSKIVNLSIPGIDFIRRNKLYKTKLNKTAEIVSR